MAAACDGITVIAAEAVGQKGRRPKCVLTEERLRTGQASTSVEDE